MREEPPGLPGAALPDLHNGDPGGYRRREPDKGSDLRLSARAKPKTADRMPRFAWTRCGGDGWHLWCRTVNGLVCQACGMTGDKFVDKLDGYAPPMYEGRSPVSTARTYMVASRTKPMGRLSLLDAAATVKAEGDFYKHECRRCQYIWYSRAEQPKQCASTRCKSPYWNRLRARDTKFGDRD